MVAGCKDKQAGSILVRDDSGREISHERDVFAHGCYGPLVRQTLDLGWRKANGHTMQRRAGRIG